MAEVCPACALSSSFLCVVPHQDSSHKARPLVVGAKFFFKALECRILSVFAADLLGVLKQSQASLQKPRQIFEVLMALDKRWSFHPI